MLGVRLEYVEPECPIFLVLEVVAGVEYGIELLTDPSCASFERVSLGKYSMGEVFVMQLQV